MKPGRPKNIKAMERVQELLDLGLKKAEIARVLKADPAQVERWVRYLDKKRINREKK